MIMKLSKISSRTIEMQKRKESIKKKSLYANYQLIVFSLAIATPLGWTRAAPYQGATIIADLSQAPTPAEPEATLSPFNDTSIQGDFDHSAIALQEDPIRTIHYHFEKQMDPYMQLHKFNTTSYNGNSVTCNDGSPAGYYKRLNNHSKSWIIYLQGGGFCGSEEACQQRWRRSPHLMSSNFWQKTKSIDGILSSEPKDNPFLWNANHIYVPYCSSDSWTGLYPGRASGTASHPNSLLSQRNSAIENDSENSGRHRARQHHHYHHHDRQSFAFMGSQIIERVLESLFEELPRELSLYGAKFILLAGDSAGATGVMLNLDKLNKLVQLKFAALSQNCLQNNDNLNCESIQPPVFRGLADSGWFLDNEPYDYFMDQFSMTTSTPQNNYQTSHRYSGSNNQYNNNQALVPDEEQQQQQYQQQQQQQQQRPMPLDCYRQRCSPLQSIQEAMLYWNGQIPASCNSNYPLEPWRCYFGYRVYQTLKTPLFVVQWLYDEAQLIVDHISRPDTVGQWNYVNRLVSDLRVSLENVTALFAPSCFSHSLIIKQDWNQININGFKLPHILNSWEEETLSNQPTIETLSAPLVTSQKSIQPEVGAHRSHLQDPHWLSQSVWATNSQDISAARPADSTTNSPNQKPTSTSGLRSPRSRKRKRNNHQPKQSSNSNGNNRLSRSTIHLIMESDSTLMLHNNRMPEIMSITTSKRYQQDLSDKFRLIDSCGWPQCNRDCPVTKQEFNTRSLLPYR